jgi:riboflavin kinase/FMN adenylyltransferase
VKVLRGLSALDPPLARSVLTIGNFDGVHLGHQQLLAQAGLLAANADDPVVVLTFEPHPLTIVAPHKAPPRLTTAEEKSRLLLAAGADLVVEAVSERELLGLEPERFVEEVILAKFHPSHIVEGPSFGFGKARRGTPELLQQLGRRHGFEVHILQPVSLEVDRGETVLVSSSLVRRLVAEGKVHRAALCLGRPYAVSGEVVRGHQRGRSIGFPTANVAVADVLIPGDGVYSARAIVDGAAHPAAVSIGVTPTFGDGRRQVEAYLLDFAGDLYGRTMRLEFSRFLRGQEKFASVDALKAQLAADVAAVRAEFDAAT